MAEKKKVVQRYRNFATIVYLDSAPEGWLEKLSETHIQAFVSPLHDKDVNPTGEPKKAHYHVMIMFDGVKTREQAKEICDLIGGVGIEILSTTRGYARYLCHLDNPEKAQYDTASVRSLGGADYNACIGLPSDRYKAIGEMMDFCEQYDIVAFSELLKYARANKFDWFKVLCDSGTYVMKEYLKSRNWDEKKNTF